MYEETYNKKYIILLKRGIKNMCFGDSSLTPQFTSVLKNMCSVNATNLCKRSHYHVFSMPAEHTVKHKEASSSKYM